MEVRSHKSTLEKVVRGEQEEGRREEGGLGFSATNRQSSLASNSRSIVSVTT